MKLYKLFAIAILSTLGGCAYYSQGYTPEGPVPYSQPGVVPVYSVVTPLCYVQPFYMNDARGRPVLVQRLVCQ